jgi:anaerobic magnesium-protoporphyrin IX monomethyl ester cyclase
MQEIKLILTLVPITHNRVYPESYEHLGLCSLAANVRKKDIDCTIMDGFFLQLTYHDYFYELLNLTKDNPGHIVGFSIMAEEFLDVTLTTIRSLRQKRPEITIIAGGMYPTWKPRELLQSCPEIDYILRGEADNSLVSFLDALKKKCSPESVDGIAYINNKIFIEGSFPFPPPNITKLPAPDRDFAPIAVSRQNLLSVSTSRGCDFTCSFCGIPGFNGKRRSRTNKQIVEEIKMLKQDFNPTLINVVDPTFIGTGSNGIKVFKMLGQELLKLNLGIKFSFEIRPDQVEEESLQIWKKVGIESVHIGVESGYLPTLQLFNKKNTYLKVSKATEILESLHIPYSTGFIMFHPWTTLEEIKINIEYSRTTLKGRNNIGLLNTLRMYTGSKISETWNGAFSPYPSADNYFINKRVELLFSKLVSEEISNEIKFFIQRNQTEGLYNFMLKLIDEIE